MQVYMCEHSTCICWDHGRLGLRRHVGDVSCGMDAHTDGYWAPKPQSKIDSGLRTDLPHPPTPPPTPPPAPTPPPPPKGGCNTAADCSGFLGECV